MANLLTRGASGDVAPPLLQRVVGWSLRHPVAAVVIVAVAARLLTALAILLFSGGILVPDSNTYHQLAREAAAGQTSDWTSYEHHLFDAVATYSWPLTAVYWLVGPVLLAGQLVSIAFGVVTVAAVVVLALEVLPRPYALAAGLTAALFPSQVLWSSLTLKDAAVWAALAMLAVCIARVHSSKSLAVLWWACGAAVSLLALGHLRDYTAVVAAWAVLGTVAVATGTTIVARRMAAVAIAVLVPLVLGLGPLGAQFIHDNVRHLPERRADLATGADSAIVKPNTTVPSSGSTRQEPTGDGEVPRVQSEEEFSANLQHLPRGLVAVLLEPTPWSAKRNVSVGFASAESLVWYPMLVAAVVGLSAAFRRRSVMAFPVLVAGAIIFVQALAEGNVGTAFRHRGEVVWAVILLAAMGVADVAARRRAARSEDSLLLV